MNREDIIRMAREAGFIINDENPMTHSLERFAALVAAAKETELMDSMTIAYMDGYEKGKDAGAIAEREACAKKLDEDARHYVSAGTVGHTISKCAAAIRARGQA